jgi:hypothetical protein
VQQEVIMLTTNLNDMNMDMLPTALPSPEDTGMSIDHSMEEQLPLNRFDDGQGQENSSCNASFHDLSSPQILDFGHHHLSGLFDQDDSTVFKEEESFVHRINNQSTHLTQMNRTNFSKVYDKPHSNTHSNTVAHLPAHTDKSASMPIMRSKTMGTHFTANNSTALHRLHEYNEGGTRNNSRLSNGYYQAPPFAQGPNNPYHDFSRRQYNKYRHDAPSSPPFLARQSSPDFYAYSTRRCQFSNMPFPDVCGRDHSPTFHEHYERDTSVLQCEDVTPLHSEGDIPTARSLSAFFIKTPYQLSQDEPEPEPMNTSWTGYQHHDCVLPESPSQQLKEPFDMHSSSAACTSQSPPSVTAIESSPNYSYVVKHSPHHNKNSESITRDLSFETDIDNILREKKRDQENPTRASQPIEGIQLSTLLQPSDRMLVSEFTNAVVDQLEIAAFCPRDRKGTRNTLAIGFPGFTCTHCKGTKSRTGGRYFPSSIKTMSDSKKTLFAISRHLSICKKCPQEVKDNVENLMSDHLESRKRNNRQGTQRAFFRNIWAFLHPLERKGE